jgi:hypothetical protein
LERLAKMITPTPKSVLDMLRKLPPRERLKVISQALPEIEQRLAEKTRAYKSLRGLWKDLRPSELWKDFPRKDIA